MMSDTLIDQIGSSVTASLLSDRCVWRSRVMIYMKGDERSTQVSGQLYMWEDFHKVMIALITLTCSNESGLIGVFAYLCIVYTNKFWSCV